MALQNAILNQPNPDILLTEYSGAGTYTWKWTVKLADIVGLAANLTGDVILMDLPANSVVLRTFVKHSTSVAGPSISACTARVQTANNNYGTTFDVFQAPGATVTDFDGLHPSKENFAAITPIYVHFIAVGANLGVATAGQVDVTITYHAQP